MWKDQPSPLLFIIFIVCVQHFILTDLLFISSALMLLFLPVITPVMKTITPSLQLDAVWSVLFQIHGSDWQGAAPHAPGFWSDLVGVRSSAEQTGCWWHVGECLCVVLREKTAAAAMETRLFSLLRPNGSSHTGGDITIRIVTTSQVCVCVLPVKMIRMNPNSAAMNWASLTVSEVAQSGGVLTAAPPDSVWPGLVWTG